MAIGVARSVKLPASVRCRPKEAARVTPSPWGRRTCPLLSLLLAADGVRARTSQTPNTWPSSTATAANDVARDDDAMYFSSRCAAMYFSFSFNPKRLND